MRRFHILACALIAAALTVPAAPSFAQIGGGGGPGGRGQKDTSEDDAAKKKKDEEWAGPTALDLPGSKNAGPCPFVKVLYDAGRYVEFKDGKEASGSVGYTGEIQKLASGCTYKGTDPIHIEVEVLFAFGRGPQATSPTKDYRYWIAVTDRNQAVLAKEYFDIKATFPQGEDRVLMTDRINDISIPRATNVVSGGNFEVLVGFDVTPEMADFNRLGKRFRVNAGAPAQTASNP
ncbi:Tat pathway signal sequence domain protein [Phenylobacterium montanum]|uniref:Tat pathway signal sequence domain protein n=1 Tax=Phenylobacterium montanum TaxID=2823693 RepID=A0A975IUE5_9CAUL|nr:Tat pathway signal sequence domain protein [Caulobacter sp. S6]QUD87723.1 Tat pathway signal sequence domain protein [Caulobacter sp. S6]